MALRACGDVGIGIARSVAFIKGVAAAAHRIIIGASLRRRLWRRRMALFFVYL